MTRTLPFMLNVQRNGTSVPSKLFFATLDEMLAKVKEILKKPFVGKMQGFVWEPSTAFEPGDWTLVQQVDDLQKSVSFEERSHTFLQAATFLKAMAKNKEPLDATQTGEFKDILEELFQVYDAEEKRLPAPTPQEEVKPYTHVNMV